MKTMYFELDPPQKWQAGSVGTKPFFFDCARCEAKEPEIAGFLADASNPTFSGVVVLKRKDSNFLKTAMFCRPCFDAEVAEAKERMTT